MGLEGSIAKAYFSLFGKCNKSGLAWVGRVKFNNNFVVRSPEGSGDGRPIFEFLMAGADHVVQRAFCPLDALSPLSLPLRGDGEIDLPPRTPILDPRSGRMQFN